MRLPRVDHVLDHERVKRLGIAREVVKRATREVLDAWRTRLTRQPSAGGPTVPTLDEIAAETEARVCDWTRVSPRSVLNGTGVLLHTNLGRAPMSASAIAAMGEAAGSCDLEIALENGRRGSRFARLRPLMAAALHAEDAHVVTNGAAALLLACTALGNAAGSGVVLSRGQMVEIGDGFRVATMAGAGGVPIVEVGSTNRTHADDYARGLDEGAAALLWVHLSNFAQQGFTKQVDLPSLSALARERSVPLIADLGSGSLGRGVPQREPTIREYLEQGADIVTCSGDKLFGGPQAGLMAGKAELVERCRRHPMARALRPDKTTLAALHATLVTHVSDGPVELPLHRMIAAELTELRARAVALCQRLGWPADSVRQCEATIGGGSLPGDTMPSISLAVPGHRPSRLAQDLRLGDPPLVGRIHDDELLVDLRTILPEHDGDVARALRAIKTSR